METKTIGVLRLHDCGIDHDRKQRFIVVDRWNGDRVEGGVEIMYEDGFRCRFGDESKQNISYIGQGKITFTIEWPKTVVALGT